MPKQNAHIAHFHVGEFSDAGLARVDLEITPLAAETQENLFPHAIGYGQVRPGLKYLGATHNDATARLIPFVRSIDDVALLELSSGTLRVWVDDDLVTRPEVVSTVTNGDFSSSTGWTLSASSGASSQITGGYLQMHANARGSEAYCERVVTTSSPGVQHALRIIVLRGPVIFRCGSSSGGQDYVSETTLDRGWHSIAFTPSTNFYVRFITREQRNCFVDSISIESAGTMAVPAPWTTDQLRSFRYDQSADVIFLANRNLQQLKIERRSPKSWSVAYYQADDGPFQGTPVEGASLTPSSTFGNTTITSDKPVFESTMVGSLIRLYHDRLDASWTLAGDDTYTDVFAIRGVKGEKFNDRQFSYQITGTWSGTLRVQRSLTGEDGDFLDYNRDDGSSTTTITGNLSVTHAGEAEDNNVISYTRIGFIAGAYTSGSATVSVQYEGASGYGVGRITAYNSATSVDIEVLENFNATSGTKSWEIGSWSDYNGWPSAVSLYDGRLWWGGLDNVWGSASDAYYSYDDLETTDSSTIQRQIATGGQVSRIAWFLPLQRMIIGTAGSEVSMRASDVDGFLTPGGVTLKDASTFGSADVQPTRLDSRGMFTHRSGLRVIAIGYSFEDNDYRSADLCELNEDICGDGVVEMAIQREPETYVWCVRDDGQCAILIYDIEDKENRIQGWSRFITDGEVKSVAVLPEDSEDAVYMVVSREGISTPSGAAQLATGAGTTAHHSFDFTDGSAVIADPDNPDNDISTAVASPALDQYGRRLGPDAIFRCQRANMYTRQADGYMAINYKNNMYPSEGGFETRWTATNVTVTDNAATAPNGEMTASLLVPDGTNDQHYITYISDFGSASAVHWGTEIWGCRQHVYSMFFKANGYNKVQLAASCYVSLFAVPTNPFAEGTPTLVHITWEVDLSTGDVTSNVYNVPLATKYAYELEDPVVEDKGSGWYRVIAKFVFASQYVRFHVRCVNDSGDATFSGSGSGVLVWGCQQHPLGVADDRYVYTSAEVDPTTSVPVDTALFPYEWDENGEPLGIRQERVMAWEETDSFQRRAKGVLFDDTVNPSASLDLFDYQGDIGCGVVAWSPNDIAPDKTKSVGIMQLTGSGGASTTVVDYTGIRINIVDGWKIPSIFVNPSLSTGQYFQIVIYRYYVGPGPDFYSVTWDIQDSNGPTVTQEYYNNGANGVVGRTYGSEAWAGGWYRLWITGGVSFGTSGAYFLGSQTATPCSVGTPWASFGDTSIFNNPPNTTYALWGQNVEYVSQNIQNSNYPVSVKTLEGGLWGSTAAPTLFYYDMRDYGTVDSDNISMYCEVQLRDVNTYAQNAVMGIECLRETYYDRYDFSVSRTNETTSITPLAWRWQAFDVDFDFGDTPVETISGGTPDYDVHEFTFNVSDGRAKYWVDDTLIDDVAFSPPQLNSATWPVNLWLAESYFGNFQQQNSSSFWIRKLFYTPQGLDGPIELVAGPGDSGVKNYIEKLSKHSMATGGTANEMCDSWVYAAGPVSSVTVAHLSGITGLIAWVTQSGTQYALSGLSADSYGLVDLGDTYTDIYIGLPYTAKYKSSKLVYGAPNGGVALMQPKRVGELGLLLENTHRDAVSFGGDFDTMRKMSLISGGKPVAANTIYTVHDQIAFSFPGYWDTDSRVCLKVEAPYPATFLGLVISVEEHERGIKPRRR